VALGDLGCCPPGSAFCIFVGATPASRGSEIRPASRVNVFGILEGDATGFKHVRDGAAIVIERCRTNNRATSGGDVAERETSMIETQRAAIERVMEVLTEAERDRAAVGPVSDLVPGGLGLELAHHVCEANIQRRLDRGERIAGFKVGFTNIPVREKMGLPDSTYGYLMDTMVLPSGGTLPMDEFVAPKIESEICFRLAKDLPGTGLTISDVIDATDAVCASFEICDARIKDWKCPYPDFFADNGFSARIVVSGTWVPVRDVDLLGETVVLSQDGTPIAEGRGEMALGHPANALIWLARRLSERGRALTAGLLVMTGTLTPITPIAAGSTYVAQFSTLGKVEKTFV
jgi:2-keto-4-pentenoate hydratase